MKKPFYLILVLTILQVVPFNSNAQQKTNTTTLSSKIDRYLTAGSKNGFSGAISVVKNGKIILHKGYGMANRNTKTLNNPNTVFDIGSNTKQFTSTAILKLVELEKLNLTDSLSRFFKNLPKDKQNITIHQLLSHSAGFTDAIGNDFDKVPQKQFFEKLFSTTLVSKPGEKYSYSNTGYSLLGRIIELVSGTSYETFLNDYLFLPAGMKQTGYLLPKWDADQMPNEYNRNILETDPTITRYQKDGDITWHLKANGGINSTQNDMLLWFKALKNNLILSEELVNKLMTPYMSMNSKKTHHYGYGWIINESISNTLRFSHNGSNGAFSHTILWYPKKDIYIVYATNANSSKVESIAYTVAKIILDKSYVPKPIKNNIYSFTMNYVRQYSTNKSNDLAALLKENYADDFNSGIYNTIGNFLLRSHENLNWALELFKMNTQLYPEDGNLWDSLGDGYKANNLKGDAIKSYQKAVELGNKDSQKKLTELIEN